MQLMQTKLIMKLIIIFIFNHLTSWSNFEQGTVEYV